MSISGPVVGKNHALKRLVGSCDWNHCLGEHTEMRVDKSGEVVMDTVRGHMFVLEVGQFSSSGQRDTDVITVGDVVRVSRA